MSIVQLNIRTRIELETRVLAAALKQSFERGDSDGVSLAHRQLFLLLKDQKTGNGSSAAETAQGGENGDTTHLGNAEESTRQQVYVPEAYAEAGTPEYYDDSQEQDSEAYDERGLDESQTAHESGYQGDSGYQESEYQEPHEAYQESTFDQNQAGNQQLEYEQSAYQGNTEHEVADNEPEYQHADYEQRSEYQQQAGYQSEVQQIDYQQAEYEHPGYESADYQQGEDEIAEDEHELAEHETAAREQTGHEQPTFQELQSGFQTAEFSQPDYQQAGYGQSEDATEQYSEELLPEFQPTQAADYEDDGGELGGDEELIEAPGRYVDEIPQQPHAQSFAGGESSHVAADAQRSPSNQSEQAHAIAQYLKYKQTRDQVAAETAEQSDNWQTLESNQIETTEQVAKDAAESETPRPLTEEEEYIRMRKAPPPKKEDLPFDQPSAEYAEIFGSSVIGNPQPAAPQTSEPASTDFFAQPPAPHSTQVAGAQPGPFDAIPEAPVFSPFDAIQEPPGYGTFYKPLTKTPQTGAGTDTQTSVQQSPQSSQTAPQSVTDTGDYQPAFELQNRGVEIESEPVEAVPGFSHLRQNTTQDLPQIQQNLEQDSHETPQNSTQDLPQVPQNATQDLPHVPQNSTQDLPQVSPNSQMLDDIRGQQAADYAARKASQSVPRNMPAIDFSLQSESTAETNKPNIDFSLQSETNKPDIDFSLQSESKKPDIDFSLQSESKKPDIDFSLQSESKKPDIDFSLQSESKKPDIDFSLESEKHNQTSDETLSAPTSGGILEAEFVSTDSEFTPAAAENTSVPERASVPGQTEITASHDHAAEPEQAESTSSPDRALPPDIVAPASSAASKPPAAPNPVPFTGIPMLASPKPAAPPVIPPPSPPILTGEAAAETTSQEEPLQPAAPRPPDLYAMLGVSQMSPFEEIHKNFLRKIRKILLRLRTAVRPERDELLKELRRNWVARDILCDPVTRTDYDFRDMGLRGSPDGAVPHVEEPQRMGQRTPLRIGELLQCAGLLEQAELEIACDMHKAMPEVQFGTFLVRQGFIQERDLDSVLLGQTLLRDGKITVAQFQVAMELSQSRGANISDTLIEHGYITAAELAQLTQKSAETAEIAAPETPVIKEVPVKPRQVEPAAQNLNTSSAVPTWKDQLDWSKPLPVDDDASLADRNPEKQSLAELLGNVNTEPNAEAEAVKISNNAAPSWKDQLDWNKPEDDDSSGANTEGARDQSTGSADTKSDEEQPSLSLAHAVPSWKDQLDWEQPKDEGGTGKTAQDQSGKEPGNDSASAADTVSGDDEDDYEDVPMTHSSKETQPISIHPPTSLAPNVTLGKGSPSTTFSAAQKSDSLANQSSPDGQSAESDYEHDVDEVEHGDGDDESDDNESSLKKGLNKLKKGDPKDKKKKRK